MKNNVVYLPKIRRPDRPFFRQLFAPRPKVTAALPEGIVERYIIATGIEGSNAYKVIGKPETIEDERRMYEETGRYSQVIITEKING